ncbi:cell division ATP-binding protein FtsE [Thermoleptolyngbya sichuanensis A183]|uniref:Cell division ATP-binding protein FtsE n=1 Tax=Thermoleptolyngbya sichuanensis A183 TaxID=2737172 RepID=A0A6M8BD24_9CYAN|nr:cell division ATP-binding protein FtsE [Thermoleptolyngbya sichuanensis]QKD81163.1 cell division ATP-binding protein FtsE [Thermoleptolyngbya sichuanensis A183]
MTTVSDRPLMHTPRDPSLRDLSSVQSRIHTIPTANPRDSIVRLQQVTKVYANGSRALENVNLQVRRGDFLFVTGPSGSGKSTLLKLLYGAERPTQGQVQVHDTNLSDLRGDRLSMLRRRIGVVFQDYKLIPRRTVAENVAFVLQAQGYARREIQRRLLPTLKMVGLHDKAERFPDELSGGEQQRVSIARAIVSTPPILLADEPTGNLDADNSWQVIKILKKLNAVGITVIITTHDDRLVRMSNHPVVQLCNGRLFHVN